MGRAPCCDKANVKRGPWSPEEDAKLKSYIETHGTGGNWITLPHKIGLKRCGKSCRLRWLNYLRPNIKHGGFTEDEDNLIYSLYNSIGSRWSIIASHLPRRTDNDIKNYWNTRLKKKLLGRQRRELLQAKKLDTKKGLTMHCENMYTGLSNQVVTPLLESGYSSQLLEPYILEFPNPLHMIIPSPMDYSYNLYQPNNLQTFGHTSYQHAYKNQAFLGLSDDACLNNYIVPGLEHPPVDSTHMVQQWSGGVASDSLLNTDNMLVSCTSAAMAWTDINCLIYPPMLQEYSEQE